MKNHYLSGVASITCALFFVGCGARDTEVDGIPGPGSRAPTRAPGPVEGTTSTEGQQSTKAGVNSAGRPAGSAGGNPGSTVIGDTTVPAPQPSKSTDSTRGVDH